MSLLGLIYKTDETLTRKSGLMMIHTFNFEVMIYSGRHGIQHTEGISYVGPWQGVTTAEEDFGCINR